jgi:hypothetical protein
VSLQILILSILKMLTLSWPCSNAILLLILLFNFLTLKCLKSDAQFSELILCKVPHDLLLPMQ